jgi:aspartyl-tRNA(Asn)/glutamyl-tRNA(Gln) amidotransferase subunit A
MATSVEACGRMVSALVPAFEPHRLASLEELQVGFAWIELADPGVRACVEAAVARFPRRRPVELPFLDSASYALFMREAADVHRELYAENAELYGEDVRIKLERCLAVRDADVERALGIRERYRERVDAALEGIDLVLTPTLPCVAPPLGAGGTGDLNVRETLLRFTYPFSSLGWPALALPCGAAEDGLPASLQIAGRAGDDALVLAAGALLEGLHGVGA